MHHRVGVYVVRGVKAVLIPVKIGAQRGGRVETFSGLSKNDVLVSDPVDSQTQDCRAVTAARTG